MRERQSSEKDSLLAAVSKKIEYYDDEELDRFKGRTSDSYTEEEIEEFRDILYSTQEVEVAGWCRSLQLRGIELPDELKDELFLIVGERRRKKNTLIVSLLVCQFISLFMQSNKPKNSRT